MEAADKKYTVIISDEATQMLISHSRFLAQVSEKAALNLIAEFSEKQNLWRNFLREILGFPILLSLLVSIESS